jgi:hypothetical protein
MSKPAWGISVSAFFGIFTAVLPLPDSVKIAICSLAGIGLIVSCVGWYCAHRRERKIPETPVQPMMPTIPEPDLSYLADPAYDRFWPETNRKKLFLRVAELLNENPRHFIADFNALILAGLQHLESNDDLVRICDELEKNGHKHPLKELGDYVPERDWLRFLQWVAVRPNTDTKWGYGYVDAAQEWPKREGYPQPATRFPLRLAVMSEIKPP